MSSTTAILVAGMHRSGTSALAGVLNLLGVPLGQHLLEPGPDNPKGYWEHRDIVTVHERLLAALGSRWDDVRALPAGWLASDAAVHAAEAIGELVTRDFAGKPLWAVKDPRLCRFLPLWFRVLRSQGIRPVVLFMVRDPGEVADSIAARNHWRTPVGEMLWLRYVTEAERASQGAPRSVVIYDDLLDAPLPTVSRALAKLDLDFDPATADGRNDLAAFIDKADRHHVHGRTEKFASRFAEISQAAYSTLRSIARGRDAWVQLDTAAADFDEYWQRHGEAIDALADMSAKLSSNAESEWVENRRLSSKLDAQIRWSDEAQASREALQVENTELQSKLAAQIQWSDHAVQEREALQARNAELASKLTAQVRWSEQAVREQGSLQAENAELQSKLAAQIQWSEQAQRRNEALQLEIEAAAARLTVLTQSAEQARLRADAVQAELEATSTRLTKSSTDLSALKAQLDASETARHELIAEQQSAADAAENLRAQLTAQLNSSQLEGKRLSGEIAALRQHQSELEGELRTVYASRSWRVTKPFRRMAVILGASVPQEGNDKRDAE